MVTRLSTQTLGNVMKDCCEFHNWGIHHSVLCSLIELKLL